MQLTIITNKTNQQILQLMEDIKEGKKGNISLYTSFRAVGANGIETNYPSFEAMYKEFRATHLYGFKI